MRSGLSSVVAGALGEGKRSLFFAFVECLRVCFFVLSIALRGKGCPMGERCALDADRDRLYFY